MFNYVIDKSDVRSPVVEVVASRRVVYESLSVVFSRTGTDPIDNSG